MQTTSSADLGLGASIATAFAAVAGVHSADRPLCAGLSPLTSNHITRVQQALARSQAHMTFETTVGLHRRLHVPMVHESLSQAAERQSARQAQLSNEETYLASPDWLERISQALQQSRACVLSETMLNIVTTTTQLTHWLVSLMHQEISLSTLLIGHARSVPTRPLRSVFCESIYLAWHSCKAKDRQVSNRYDKALHSVGGMPTCRLCGQRFPRWSGLRTPFNAGQCRGLGLCVPDAPLPSPPPPQVCRPTSGHEDTALPSSLPTGLPAQVEVPEQVSFEPTQHPSPTLPLSPETSIPVNPEPDVPPSPNAGNVEQPLAYTPSFQAQLRRQGWPNIALQAGPAHSPARYALSGLPRLLASKSICSIQACCPSSAEISH